jgi:hypothetical protein
VELLTEFYHWFRLELLFSAETLPPPYMYLERLFESCVGLLVLAEHESNISYFCAELEL